MIQINEEYFVEVDSYNYTLKRRYPGKNKKDEPIIREKIIGYYGDLKGCLRGVLKDTQSRKFSEDTYTLTDAIRVIQETTDYFIKLLNEKIKEV